jgi:hypothetical protein
MLPYSVWWAIEEKRDAQFKEESEKGCIEATTKLRAANVLELKKKARRSNKSHRR